MGSHADEQIASHLRAAAGRACDSLEAVDYTNFVTATGDVLDLVAQGLEHIAAHLGEDEGVTPQLEDEAKALRETTERVMRGWWIASGMRCAGDGRI